MVHGATAVDRRVADPDFDGRIVRVMEIDRPESGRDEALTAQSIRWMQQLADRDAATEPIRIRAKEIREKTGSDAATRDIADAIFWTAKQAIRYQHEDEMATPFSDFLHFIYDQTLIGPEALLSMPEPRGDCVDYSMVVASLARNFGIPTAYKTIAADPASDAYSHVYVMAEIAPGEFYALDASNGPAPGFEFALQPGRKSRTWPNPADYTRPRMIHEHRRRRQRPTRLQDISTDDPGSYYPDTSGSYDVYANAGVDPSAVLTQYPSVATPPIVAASSVPAWTKITTAIINDASAIAAPLIRQSSVKAPYYIQGAGGAQILYDPSTGRAANASAGTQVASVLSPSLIIGLGLAAVLIVAVTAKR